MLKEQIELIKELDLFYKNTGKLDDELKIIFHDELIYYFDQYNKLFSHLEPNDILKVECDDLLKLLGF